ncbi:hypothetical protein TRFO_36860 [Tritrichomonas foetus]|uniref:UDENN domain-containing protein n=1 Tax=Tritrichomonas foetus TaxID=1144522 RepID=A0A1J4JD11_9EUKA|nr:hypothetical protein TRFO_36860 [Tritrichomonas foetus]|eukprot:OHS97000.1 hypothetical protein TRFO_36860 [Tritrichomonas foetus]
MVNLKTDGKEIVMSENTKIENDFCVALILLEHKPKSVTFLKTVSPEDFNFDNDLRIIIDNGFRLNDNKTSIKYAFTTKNHWAFTWNFKGDKENYYSIIILTIYNLPSLYFSFFEEIQTETSSNLIDFDSLVFVDFIYSLLLSWKLINHNTILVNFPTSTKYVKLDIATVCFTHINAFQYFQHDEITQIWRTLLTGSGLLIICDDPEILSSAVFAACSLIYPVEFRDRILITMNEEDERLLNLQFYSIVATTSNVEVNKIRNFGCITNVIQKNEFVESGVLKEKVLQKTLKVLEILVFLMDRILLINPYNDVLEGPYVTDDFEDIFKMKDDKRKYKTLPPDAFRQIEKTKTMIFYRRKIVFRSTFRNSFLSINPETALCGMSHQHLLLIYQKLDLLGKKFSSDKHFMSVINIHRKVIKKYLLKFKD